MGAGVGKLVRLTSLVAPGKTIVKLWHYELRFLKQCLNYVTYKIPNKLLIKSVTNKKKRFFS